MLMMMEETKAEKETKESLFLQKAEEGEVLWRCRLARDALKQKIDKNFLTCHFSLTIERASDAFRPFVNNLKRISVSG